MNKLWYIVFGLFLISFTSCEEKFELNDEYKDISVVYGLIDPVDSISYIRIEKAFLTDGEIYQAAQVPDSNLYNYKLNVRILDKYDNEIVVFDTMTIYNKEDGVFYSDKMQIYYAVTKGLFNDIDEYKLEIYNPKLRKYVSSSSKFIDARKLELIRPRIVIDFSQRRMVQFKSIKGGRLYAINTRFHYIEEDVQTGDSTYFYVDWVHNEARSNSLIGDEVLKVFYEKEEFYDNLRDHIPIKENVIRHLGHVELIITVADEVFNMYMDLNKPSTSIIFDRPEFSNITNGYGLFACRSKRIELLSLNMNSKVLLYDIKELRFQQPK